MLFISLDKLLVPDSIDSIDGLELRLDLFPSLDFTLIDRFIKTCKKPIMLTLRSVLHGGKFEGERKAFILKLLELKPAFFDLESDMEDEFLGKTLKKYPLTKFILSHHFINHSIAQEDLESIYSHMKKYPAFGYKIAASPSSTNQTLSMLLFSKARDDLSVICMGDCAGFARVLGPIIGNLIDYAALDEESKTAPGQMSLSELVDIYRYPHLNKETVLYGLIGDPIDKSLGHLYHNKVFKEKNLNSVYIKMAVKPEELSSFFPLAQRLGFRGLSVTRPLKETVYPFTQPICSKINAIQAINTLLITKETILSTNTDGKGALDAIEKRVLVKDKILVLIGAGGAAKAIAFEAKLRGARVRILNRTLQRGIDLAFEVGCEFLHKTPENYDIVINCSPDPGEFDYSNIKRTTLVMDVVYNPRQTHFLQRALELGAVVIDGEEMFLNQAQAQTEFWT
jgi:3-dehydroquinate dehydratase/shikimate dehydrogenase